MMFYSNAIHVKSVFFVFLAAVGFHALVDTKDRQVTYNLPDIL